MCWASRVIPLRPRSRGPTGTCLSNATRIVVGAPIKTVRERQSRETGDYIYSQNVDYDEFWCSVAEKVGDACYLRQYTLRFSRLDWDDHPQGKWWVVSDMQTDRILAENVDK